MGRVIRRVIRLSPSIIVFPAILFLLFSCAITQKQSMSEIAALREAREKASTHYFKNVSSREVEEAIVKTFKLLDPKDVDFDLRKSKILVSRWWTYYAVFSVGWGKDFWEINLTDDHGGVLVSAAFVSERNDGPFASRITTPFRENITIGGNVNDGASVADYYLLYRRIEYFLGQRESWTTCEDARKIRRAAGEEMVLCDRIGIEDNSPLDAR